MQKEKILAFDVGGTFVKSAVVRDREAFDFKLVKTPLNLDDFIKLIQTTTEEAAQKHQFKKIGLGLPGFINFKQQIALTCPNLPYLDNFSPDILQTDEQIIIANDADLALSGEIIANNLSGKTCALFTLGTGVGGAISFGGLWPFDISYSGEFGHIKIVKDGPPCDCGQRGCLESFIGKKAIITRAKQTISPEINTVLEVFESARNNNPQAVEIVEDFGKNLAIGIANVVNITGVQTFFLSGQIAKSADLFFGFIKPQLAQKVSFYANRDIEVRIAFDPEKNALFGAQALFKENA